MTDRSPSNNSMRSRRHLDASYLEQYSDYQQQDTDGDFPLQYGSVLPGTRRPRSDGPSLQDDGHGIELLARQSDLGLLHPEFGFTRTTQVMGDDDDDDDDDEDNINDDGDTNNDGEDVSSVGEYYQDPNKPVTEDSLFHGGIQKLEMLGMVDIGNLASWNVSSHKTGYGVKELREDTPSSYWQSDGTQPHYITVHFTKRVSVERISLYLNFQTDESYTPSKIRIFAGNGEHDLMEVSSKEFKEPVGWQHVTFKGIRADNLLKCYMIKIVFDCNHQNGKDSHVRAIKIFSPLGKNSLNLDDSISSSVGFTSIRLLSESVIR